MSNTLIIMILDESGSMDTKINDVLGGFNGFIENEKNVANDTVKFYLVKFNTDVSVVHRGVHLEDVRPLTKHNYLPAGGTALYDAEGVRIADRDKNEEERVIVVIMTDGEENLSKETTKQQIRDIIIGHEAQGDWTFLCIGENPDRWTDEAGMSSSQCIGYDLINQVANFERADRVLSTLRSAPPQKGTWESFYPTLSRKQKFKNLFKF